MTALVDEYEQRVTIDLDGKDYPSFEAFRLAAVETWHNLKHASDRVDVAVSSGQHGLHLVAWFEADVPFHDQLEIRRAHGDDPRRIDMDCQRWLELGGRFSDVLFTSKGDRSQTKTRFPDVYDALDYIDSLRDDLDRLRRLAVEGHRAAPELARRADR
jgi:hypothetical protein